MSEPPPTPALRASDADREAAAERLRWAAGDGQLSFEELDDRLTRAYESRTRAELEALTADLQTREGEVVAASPAATKGFTVRRGEGGAQWLVAIMGGRERRGRWRLARRCTVVNVMGGSELDLNEVELADDRVELTVVSVMGGAEIYVPSGLNVEVAEFALMGANEVDVGEDHPVAGGPVLRLNLFSLMGGAEVRRGRKLTRAERQALKQKRRDELGS